MCAQSKATKNPQRREEKKVGEVVGEENPDNSGHKALYTPRKKKRTNEIKREGERRRGSGWGEISKTYTRRADKAERRGFGAASGSPPGGRPRSRLGRC